MITNKLITKNVIVIDKAYCDFCNKKFDDTLTKCHGFGQLSIEFGYGSIFDGDNFNYQICDDCYKEKFKKFITLEQSVKKMSMLRLMHKIQVHLECNFCKYKYDILIKNKYRYNKTIRRLCPKCNEFYLHKIDYKD